MEYKKIYDEFHTNGYMEEHELGAYGHIRDHLNKLNLSYESVLDVGCSIGNGVKLFNEMGKKCTGLDVSSVAVNIALSRKLLAVESSSTKIPFENNSFDLVVSTDMLEHLTEEDVLLASNEIIRVSKKYIALKIATIIETNNYWAKMASNIGVNIPNLHLSIFNLDKWKSYFNNLKIIEESFNSSAQFVILIYEKQ